MCKAVFVYVFPLFFKNNGCNWLAASQWDHRKEGKVHMWHFCRVCHGNSSGWRALCPWISWLMTLACWMLADIIVPLCVCFCFISSLRKWQFFRPPNWNTHTHITQSSPAWMVTAARERADEELSIGERDSDFNAGIDFCVFSCVEIFLQQGCCWETICCM